MTKFVPDFGTRQFLMKNLFWKEPSELAIQSSCFNKKWMK
jgi:hypothetical protein